jgi:Flp pilus assembly protein TadD
MVKFLLYILLLTLSFNLAAQQLPVTGNGYSKTETDLKMQLLQKDISAIDAAVKQSIAEQQQDVEHIETQMDWWLAGMGIWVTLISIAGAGLGYWLARKTYQSETAVKEEVKKVQEELEKITTLKAQIEDEKCKVETLGQEIEQTKQEADAALKTINDNKERSNAALAEQLKNTRPEELQQVTRDELAAKVEQTAATKPESQYTAEDWFFKGYDAQVNEQLDEAIIYYHKATEINPNLAEAYSNWGTALSDLAKKKGGDEALFQQSFEKFRQATALNQQYAAAYNNWGIALSNQAKIKGGDEALFKQSFEKFRQATALNPNYAVAYNNWGLALSDLAEIKGGDEALFLQSFEKYKQATKLDPKDAAAYYNWGTVLLTSAQMKNTLPAHKEEIEKLLLKAEEIKQGKGSYNLACLYALLGEKNKALKWLEKDLQYNKEGRTRKFIENDKDFANIKDSAEFVALLDKYFPQ